MKPTKSIFWFKKKKEKERIWVCVEVVIRCERVAFFESPSTKFSGARAAWLLLFICFCVSASHASFLFLSNSSSGLCSSSPQPPPPTSSLLHPVLVRLIILSSLSLSTAINYSKSFMAAPLSLCYSYGIIGGSWDQCKETNIIDCVSRTWIL